MNPLKPNAVYKRLRVDLAYEESIDDEKAVANLKWLLVHQSLFSDWLIAPTNKLATTGENPKPGDALGSAQWSSALNRQFRVLARYRNRAPLHVDLRTLEGARQRAAELIHHSNPEHQLVDVIIHRRASQHLVRRRGRIQWELVETIKPQDIKPMNERTDNE